MKRARLGTALAVLAATAACGRGAHYDKPLTPVEVAPVTHAPAATGTRFAANIEAAEQVPLAFRAGGYVREIADVTGQDGRRRALQEGDRVRRGDVLARVESREYEAAVAAAEGQVGEAEAALAQAERDAARARRLFEAASLTRPDLEAAETRREMAMARVAGARAQAERAGVARSDTALRAPLDGVVLRRAVEGGQLVAPGTVGFVLADTRSAKAVFGVSDGVVGRLALGDPLAVQVDALPGRALSGTITRINPAADPRSRVFDVEILLANPDGELRPGMIAALDIGAESAPAPALAVPLSAVVRAPGDPQGFAVYAVAAAAAGADAAADDLAGERATVRLRPVRLGEVYGNLVEVVTGLGPEDRVVVTGATLVADGDLVRIVPRARP